MEEDGSFSLSNFEEKFEVSFFTFFQLTASSIEILSLHYNKAQKIIPLRIINDLKVHPNNLASESLYHLTATILFFFIYQLFHHARQVKIVPSSLNTLKIMKFCEIPKFPFFTPPFLGNLGISHKAISQNCPAKRNRWAILWNRLLWNSQIAFSHLKRHLLHKQYQNLSPAPHTPTNINIHQLWCILEGIFVRFDFIFVDFEYF